MKRQSPLAIGIIYIALGIVFTLFAVQTVRTSGWGFFVYFLILLATLDIGSGIRMLMIHYKIKSSKSKKKK